MGFWIVGLAGEAPILYTDFDYRRAVAIIVGAEGEGLH
jgi:tRNA G18 (ribose-2'-O)-methylase SpoU